MKRSVISLLVVLLFGSVLNAAEKIDVSAITYFAPKGRVQDKSYNPNRLSILSSPRGLRAFHRL